MEHHSCALPKGDLFAGYLGKALWVCFKCAGEGALLEDRIAHCCALAEEMSTGLDVTLGAVSKWFAWWDAAQSSWDATWCWHALCFPLFHHYSMQLGVHLFQGWSRSIHQHIYRSRGPSAWDNQPSWSKAVNQRNWAREHPPSIH